MQRSKNKRRTFITIESRFFRVGQRASLCLPVLVDWYVTASWCVRFSSKHVLYRLYVHDLFEKYDSFRV